MSHFHRTLPGGGCAVTISLPCGGQKTPDGIVPWQTERCEDWAIPLWIQRRRHVLFEKDNQRSATDPDPEVDVAKSEIVPDELPFPEGVPVPEIPDEPGLSSQLYQAQIRESQDVSSTPSLGGQRQVGEPGSGLMQPGLSNELYQASSNSDLDETVAYGISEYSDVACSEGLEMEENSQQRPSSQVSEDSDDLRNEAVPRTQVTRSGREVRCPAWVKDYAC